MIGRPMSENERLYASVLIVFIVYFALNSLIFSFFGDDSPAVHYLMTLSFLGGMAAGVGFFILTGRAVRGKVVDEAAEPPVKRNLEVLRKALSADEVLLMDLIAGSEGVTQDSLRFKTGFSKSKVSALVSELEKKDILVRERLGRTYRVFIADWLKK
ncbi:MAG: hypothetical protein D6733_00370 [Methanobacteriota archaeon]|nr:MAG: hypothetical protein D6733_00370 [Euryarchaeota archaeon]